VSICHIVARRRNDIKFHESYNIELRNILQVERRWEINRLQFLHKSTSNKTYYIIRTVYLKKILYDTREKSVSLNILYDVSEC